MPGNYFETGGHFNTAGKATVTQSETSFQKEQSFHWGWLLEIAALLGLSCFEIYRMTLPEVLLMLRGWQRSRGIDPDKDINAPPMTMDRLKELIKKEK